MSNQQVNQSVPKHNDGLQADQFDENILVFDNIFSRGYGFSPQVLTRLPQLSIEAKGLYSYFSSFAGQGGVAFPSTQTILKETNISKNRFYKYRDELEAWGFITVEVRNTRHGRQTVYHLPVEPKPSDKVHKLIDAATQARMHKVNNLPNAAVDNSPALDSCGKPVLDGYPQTPGQEPRPQNEDLAYPCPQNQDDPRPQNEDMLNIVKSNKGKVSIDLSETAHATVVDNSGSVGSRTADDPGCDTYEDARLRSLSGAEAPIDTLASSLKNFSLSFSIFVMLNNMVALSPLFLFNCLPPFLVSSHLRTLRLCPLRKASCLGFGAEKHLPLPERPRAIRRWLAQAEPSEGASESPTRFLRSTRNPGQGTDIGKSDAAVPTSPASP